MASVLQVIINARNDASKELAALNKGLKGIQNDMAAVGKTGLAMGAPIVAGLALSAKAAEAERVNIARLQSQLKNVGIEYANVEKQLEANITTTQRKTGIADDQQRIALGDLVMVTGDYNKALSLLPMALDLSAAKQIDVSTAAELVGKVAQGNLGVLSRYGIVLGENATASDALAAIQKQVAGAAEATASPFKVLQASLGDMSESLGAAVLPALTNFIGKTALVIDNIKAWADEHPTLVKWIGAVGLALVGGGGLLFAISKIIGVVRALQVALVTMQSIAGPAGWATLAAGVGIAIASVAALNNMMDDSTKKLMAASGAATDYSSSLQDIAASAGVANTTNESLAAAFASVEASGQGANRILDFTKMTMAEMEAYAKDLMGTVMTFAEWQAQSNQTAFTNAYGSGWGAGADERAWLEQQGSSWSTASYGQLQAAFDAIYGTTRQSTWDRSGEANFIPGNQAGGVLDYTSAFGGAVAQPNITVVVQVGNKVISDAVAETFIDEG